MKEFLSDNSPSASQSAIPGIESVPTCPPPSTDPVSAPSGLDIDRKSQLLGNMAAHKSQIVVCTGRPADSWPNKIEFDPNGWIARGLKQHLQPGGRLADHAPAMITFSDFPRPSENSLNFYLFPKYRSVSMSTSAATGEAEIINRIATILNDEMAESKDHTLDEVRRDMDVETSNRTEFFLFVCGHNQRDCRCGQMAGPLRQEFEKVLLAKGIRILKEADNEPDGEEPKPFSTARIGLISHIGGHKFAGNVIIRVPPQKGHPLSGMEIWYGRVEPKHVEGIVEETMVHGRVILELLRGINGRDGNPIAVKH
jgi:(2Fe-2S) ferredoxin